MVKKLLTICICATMLLTGCQWDPYSDRRPFDYGEARWVCATVDYEISFNVDMDLEDYYHPEGELVYNEKNYFCKFYFIHQTNQLHISVYPYEFADIPDDERNREKILYEIIGECDFASDSFTFHIDKSRDTLWNGKVEKLVFLRMEKEK